MTVKNIASRNNPIFKMFLRLLKGQGVKKYGAALLSGPKQVAEVLKDFPARCAGFILPAEQDVPQGILPEHCTIYHLDNHIFRDIDIYGTDRPILLVTVEGFPQWSCEDWSTGCTLFVPFQDPVNVGAVIRSAAAFGVSRAVMLKEAAHPFHHKSTRVAGSTLLKIPIFRGPPIMDLDGAKTPIVTLSAKGRDAGGYRFPSTFGLLPGLEGPGLPSGLRQSISLAIPMAPGVESINAALATGIALYLWRSGLDRTP
ncbi:hypothetical protein N9174_02655 [bacterium]|nr:hypothetical protein [bacterium]